MENVNTSSVIEFILLGLSENPEQTSSLFALFIMIYLVTILGNGLIISLILMNHELQTPMYFFLGNLSFVDISFISVTVPLMVAHLLMDKKSISFTGCFTQLFFFIWLAVLECLLLSIMAYDRLVAITNPLRYLSILDRKTCLSLVSFSWMYSFLHSILYTYVMSSMDYCGLNKVNEHFCDSPPLLALSCSNPVRFELLVYTEGSVLAISPFVFIMVSYLRIIKTISSIHSSSGKYRAFQTCSSHLISVGLFFGTILISYFHPTSAGAVETNRPITLVYSILTPLLNPFIYSLRNQQVKGALLKRL